MQLLEQPLPVLEFQVLQGRAVRLQVGEELNAMLHIDLDLGVPLIEGLEERGGGGRGLGGYRAGMDDAGVDQP